MDNSELLRRDYPLDYQWLDAAVAQARQAGHDVPVGCVIVHEGAIIAQGHNNREATNDPTGHAEIIALREAATVLGRWRLTGCTLYTTLEPCPMCAEAIIQARISRLLFGAWDPVNGAAGSVFNLFVPGRPWPLPDVIGGLNELECQELLLNFFRQCPQ